MKKIITLSLIVMLCFTCKLANKNQTSMKVFIPESMVKKITESLITQFGDTQKLRIEKGVTQSASLWRESDGSIAEFEKFCNENFIASEGKLDTVFQKLSRNFELLSGSFNKLSVMLKEPIHLNGDEILPVDEIFGAYEPSAHLNDDFFANKIAFTMILNFPCYTLKEKTELGPNWSRKQWAYARFGDFYTSRVPAELIQKFADETTKADSYIAEYNIYLGNLLNDKAETLFPADLKLITHWGLRDEIKSNYADKEKGLEKQQMIYEVMKRIISQDIPKDVINSPNFKWNPKTNILYKDSKEVSVVNEPNTRYQILLNNFLAVKAIDAYSPNYPTYIKRKFDLELEIPEEDVEKLFITLLSSPEVKQVATLISKRLGRKLQPFDIWYDGFKSRSSISQTELDKKTKAKYPNRDAVQKDLPEILKKLGFKPEKAAYIVDKIQVDASRGAGHAWGSQMKGDKARLRTRIGKDGMDYKGYNIAVHEFGHTVEQTLTLYDMDYWVLSGVPNTAFTEALAFLFQKKDLELLGIKDNDVNKDHLMALDNFWGNYEIMGVSLVDMQVWRWLYEHPTATASQLKDAVISISKEVWNKYYANIFGVKDEPILAIYSHMIDYPLYLPAYPVGHLIEFQIDKQIEGKQFADEVIRIFGQGRIIPQQWMKGAVGKEISVEPLLVSVDEALKLIK
jgi:hypothetical protein